MESDSCIPQERAAKLTLIIGTNGTGKTTVLHNILEKSGQKCLVITTHINEWTEYETVDLQSPSDFIFDGIRRHDMRRDYTLDRLQYFKKGIIVFDDCYTMIKPVEPRLESLLINRRQNEVDIFYVAHGFTRVRPVFYPYYSDIILFQTKDSIGSRKNYILNYEDVLAAQTEVNKKAVKKPHYFKIVKAQ